MYYDIQPYENHKIETREYVTILCLTSCIPYNRDTSRGDYLAVSLGLLENRRLTR